MQMNHIHDSGTRCIERRHPHRARARHAARITLIALACVSLCSAPVEAQSTGADAAKPLTVAANGVNLTIGVSSAAATAAGAGQAKGPSCTGEVRQHSTVDVAVGKSTMVALPEPVRTRTVGNPDIVQAMLVSPQTLYVLGTDVGATNMIIQGRSGSCSVIDVVVGVDPGGLQATLASLMPEEHDVRVSAAADSLVLSGTVADAVKVQRVLELANAFVQRATRPVAQAQGASGAAAAAGASGGGLIQPADKNLRIINMLTVGAPQQVMLEVKVAEVSKTLIDELGAEATLNGSFGSWTFGLLANFLSGGAGKGFAVKSNKLPFGLAVDAQKSDQLVKVLAEPNLMAISGQQASFLAGGKVFIPVAQTANGTTTITLQEEDFGIGLTFTPTVLEGGRINLTVAPEVSDLSPTGATVTSSSGNTTAVLPLITTRRASTTLQVLDGQSFAIGGLIKNNITGTINALPGAGEIPVLGALFRSTNFQQDRTELVFVVTPHLVKPLPANYTLPTDHFGEVNEAGVLLTSNMEGSTASHAPPPAAGTPQSALPANAPGVTAGSSAGTVAPADHGVVVPAAGGQPTAPAPALPATTSGLLPAVPPATVAPAQPLSTSGTTLDNGASQRVSNVAATGAQSVQGAPHGSDDSTKPDVYAVVNPPAGSQALPPATATAP
jgi:pilus assembly protein CpaC